VIKGHFPIQAFAESFRRGMLFRDTCNARRAPASC